jgi:hypothetical protein
MLIAWASVWMGGCKPDEFDLGTVDVNPADLVEGIAFKIEHDAENPNIVYLTSLMDSRYTPLWDHPQGRSQAQKVTLKIPFEGTYEVKFGVQTRGGIVFGEPATFTIDDFHAGFVDHELWTLLSGGVGQEKTWYLDLDEEGLSRYFVGPLFFYGMDDSWETVTEGKTVEGDSWNWKPDYKGNSWLMAAGDYGTMTFSLKEGATVHVDHKMLANRGIEQGTYIIDTDNYTMRMNDASPLHNAERDGHVVDWGNIRILSLTEDYMQLAVIRDKELSGEDPCLLVYNYISKDYKDNWVPGNQPDPEPPYDGNANDDLTTSISTSKTWRVNMEAPYNWTGLDGTPLNVWVPGNGIPVFEGWEPPYDESLLSNISLTMIRTGENSGQYIWNVGSGETIAGTYTVDDKNWIDFGRDIPIISEMGWINMETDGGKLRIIRAEKDVNDQVSVLHLGRINPGNAQEYMTLALVPAGAGGEPVETGKEIPVDNSKIAFGDLEGNGNLRLELFNAYGSTAQNPSVDTQQLRFEKKMTVTFTLGGITLRSGAAGEYVADIGFAAGGWDPSYWGGGSEQATVRGNGTYTVWFTPESRAEGAEVFVVDIKELAHDIVDMSTVTARIDKVIIE